MRSEVHFVSLDGAELAVEACGHGDAVVLVHGFADDRRSLAALSAALSDRYKVIRYDLRGHGQSSETGSTPFRHSQDLLDVLKAMAIERCDLVGISMGGGICLNFALEYPDRVRRLALISPGIVGWEWSEEWKTLWARIVDAASRNISAARQLWLDHPLFASARRNAIAAESLKQGVAAYSGRHWIENHEMPAYPDLDRLTSLAVPTLLLTGEHDLPDFRLIADLIAAAAPDCRRMVLEDCGHMLHLEQSEKIIGCLLEYLA